MPDNYTYKARFSLKVSSNIFHFKFCFHALYANYVAHVVIRRKFCVLLRFIMKNRVVDAPAAYPSARSTHTNCHKDNQNILCNHSNKLRNAYITLKMLFVIDIQTNSPRGPLGLVLVVPYYQSGRLVAANHK